MNAKLFVGIVVATAVVGCASWKGSKQVDLVNVSVYRGVDANAQGVARLTAGQMRFNPDLSTFNNPAANPASSPCNYRFTVVGVPSPVVQAASGTVQHLPAGYVATFDNNPPGHWGIAAPAAAAASEVAASAASSNRAGNVFNGARNNCS